jgi:hypothetical protein
MLRSLGLRRVAWSSTPIKANKDDEPTLTPLEQLPETISINIIYTKIHTSIITYFY